MNATGRIATALAVVTALALLGTAVAAPAAATTDGDGETAVVPADRAGPPTDLPGPVPGFVERLLGTIHEFVTALSTVTG